MAIPGIGHTYHLRAETETRKQIPLYQERLRHSTSLQWRRRIETSAQLTKKNPS